MLINDVVDRDRVFEIVANNLRTLGVKPRVKRYTRKVDNIDKHGDYSKKIFNVPLSHQPLDGVQISSGAIVHVPTFIKQTILFLDKYINQEGLFRKAGSQARQKELVSRLDSGNGLGDKYQGIDVANCLKKYFRDLPEPIIPFSYHDLFVRCGMLKICKVEAILLACLLLPSVHLNTLVVFMDFLKKVSLHESQNKMSTDNLAKVIGPNIMPLRETTMSAMQTRLEAHLTIVKILIENAKRIGVLPKNIMDTIQNDLHLSTELEIERISEDRLKEKKKKHRSGSLTRMFNGLKKIVGKNGSPEANLHINGVQGKDLAVESTNISPNKSLKKRKMAELSMPPPNLKKKRNSLDAKLTISTSVPSTSSRLSLSRNSNTTDNKNSAIQKSRTRKYMPYNAHADGADQKIDKSKILKLNLDRFVPHSRHKINNFEVEKEIDTASPIERRWSLASSTQSSLVKPKSQNRSASVLIISPSVKRQSDLFPKNNTESYDRVFMDANINLSDENIQRNGMESIGQHRRRSSRRHSFMNDNLNKSLFTNDHSIKNIDAENDEYVKIPKSEYEEIKNRVSAIESRISQEFNNITDHNLPKKLLIDTASEVQNKYEKTLGEAGINSMNSADHLARQMSKDLKIRESVKVIRSPSARRISNLRRRSQEKPVSSRKRVSRISSWQVSDESKTNNSIMSTKLQSSENNIDSFCSDATNARLSYLHRQLRTLISHTAEHTGSLSSDDEIPGEIIKPLKPINGIRRASSFHGSGRHIGDAIYYNNQVGDLRKANSQQNIVYESRKSPSYNSKTPDIREKKLSWKDASAYLECETPTKSMHTPNVIQTGRPSIAKLRTQNAGMVLAKAKLFDHNENKNSQESLGESYKVKSGQRRSKEFKVITPTEISHKKKCKSPKNVGGRLKIVQASNDSNPIEYIDYQLFDKRGNRRQSSTCDQENRRTTSEFMLSSRTDSSKSTNANSTNSSSRIRTTTLSLMTHDTNIVNRVTEHDELTTTSIINTPHIKKPLSMKTPKSARSLARRPPIDARRTPLKAVPTSLSTPKRHSPRTTFKSRQITRNININ
ncbi:hypothetical protein PV327_000900 [Microctonus hyperodae]|uniref:Rho-GAP domain-containing protein n=1 Tax=Microctonus hyperodae TaxID=165561 RepID=A0AA39L2S1_MICHY|nr:hypothetical protein PV327_000900 [Microctonus hyperodae]